MESQQHTDNKVMGLDEISAESRGKSEGSTAIEPEIEAEKKVRFDVQI